MGTKKDNLQIIKECFKDMKKSMDTINKTVEYLDKNSVNFLILSDISRDIRKAKKALEAVVYNYKIHRLW